MQKNKLYPKICSFCKIPYQGRKHSKFCSQKCHYASARVTKICVYCGKQFEINKSRKKAIKHCSKKCRLADGWVTSNPSKKTIFTCRWCGKKFEGWTYRQRTLCSAQCRSEYGARQPKPSTKKPENFVIISCAWCEKEYRIHKSFTQGKRHSRFCSAECRDSAASIEKRGAGNPNWTGGTLPANKYGPNWGSQKKKTKRRDKHACRICGYKSGGSVFLDVHHIVKLKMFNGDWETGNKLSNLITLCRTCHAKVEKGKIPCPIP